jgi:hypothetical protein
MLWVLKWALADLMFFSRHVIICSRPFVQHRPISSLSSRHVSLSPVDSDARSLCPLWPVWSPDVLLQCHSGSRQCCSEVRGEGYAAPAREGRSERIWHGAQTPNQRLLRGGGTAHGRRNGGAPAERLEARGSVYLAVTAARWSPLLRQPRTRRILRWR